MKADVTPDGVNVPKSLLDGVDTVEIRREGSHIILIPLNGGPAVDLGNEDTDETIRNIFLSREAEARAKKERAAAKAQNTMVEESTEKNTSAE